MAKGKQHQTNKYQRKEISPTHNRVRMKLIGYYYYKHVVIWKTIVSMLI
jgi:hypothetical protein